jgi:hypothetical protein
MAKRKIKKNKTIKTNYKRQTVDEKVMASTPCKEGNIYKSYYATIEPKWNRPVGGKTRFMICRNSINGGKYWKGILCGNWCAGVGDTAVAILCSRCTHALVPYEEKYARKSDKPRGWAFMKEYVHKDGTVYHKGKEQPDLKGTLEPTVIKKKDPKLKLTKGQKQQKRNDLLLEFNTLKKQWQKEKRKTYQAKIKSQMNKIQRELKKVK